MLSDISIVAGELYKTAALGQLETLDLSLLLYVPANDCPTYSAIAEAGSYLEDFEQGLLFAHMMRLGAHDVRGGLLDLLYELKERLALIGQVDLDGSFVLPVGQRVLAEALGVSVVHINQTLKRLVSDNLITVVGKRLRLSNSTKRGSIGAPPSADEPLATNIVALHKHSQA